MSLARRTVKKHFSRINQALPETEISGIVVGPVDGKPNYLQVRLKTKLVVEAFNLFCPPSLGLRVRLAYDKSGGGRWVITNVRDIYPRDVPFPLLKQHSPTHTWGGGDTAWIWMRQILPLRVSVNATTRTSIDVRDGWYQYRGSPRYFEKVIGQSLASHIPSADARFVLITIDENNALKITDGSTAPVDDLAYTDVPAIPEYETPLAAIRLMAGTTRIRDTIRNTDLHDLRFIGTGPAENVELSSTGAVYFGDKATDGTWRIIRSGDDFEFQRRESGNWVMKGEMQA